MSHKHLIRTVLRQVSCLHLAIVPRGFIPFDQIERSSDLPFWCGSVHTSALACFLSGVLVCLVCVCVRYPVSVLLSGSRWLVPALDRTWTQASPSQPGHRPILPSILRYHFFLPCLLSQLVVLPLSILPTLTILDTLASPSIYYCRLSGAMDLDMSSGSGTPQVQPQAQQQGDSQAPGPPAPSTSTSTSAGGVSFRR